MTERQTNEALEKLNRGIQESRQKIQEQSMKLAQDYFDDSVEALKQEIKESRDTLEGLPEQIPGGQEEAFQMLFQELMDNYAAIEDAIGESQKNVANLDTEQLRRQGELNASEAARREARELGVDLTEVEGTGSGGNITVKDVRRAAEEAEAAEDAAAEEINASDAARRRAEELGIDLSEVEGTGSGGMITIMDVSEFAEEAGDAAGQAAQGATDTAGQATQQAGQAVDGATESAGQAAQGAADQVGSRNGSEEEPKATNAARRKAEELGVDLSNIEGSGAGGLITIKDVVQA